MEAARLLSGGKLTGQRRKQAIDAEAAAQILRRFLQRVRLISTPALLPLMLTENGTMSNHNLPDAEQLFAALKAQMAPAIT